MRCWLALAALCVACSGEAGGPLGEVGGEVATVDVSTTDTEASDGALDTVPPMADLGPGDGGASDDGGPTCPEGVARSGPWTVEVVHGGALAEVGSWSSLVIGPWGRAISYQDYGSKALKLAVDSGGQGLGWAIDTLSQGLAGYYSSLAHAPGADELRVAFQQRGAEGAVVLGGYASTGWESVVVDGPVPGIGAWTHLVVDEADANHLVYMALGEAGGVARYATDAAGAWAFEAVSDPAHDAQDVALAVREGVVHVVYHDASEGDLWYARGPGDWARELVWAEDTAGTEPAIALGPDGSVHVAFDHETVDDLHYARRTSEGWEVEVVFEDFTGQTGETPDVVVGAEGRVHLVSEAQGFNYSQLMYATRLGGGSEWELESVDLPGDEMNFAGTHPSLALDALGRPVVAYGAARIGGPGELRLAVRDGGSATVDCP